MRYARLYLWLVAHRRWVLGVTALIAAISAVISARIDLDEDLLATLPQNDRLVDEYRYAIRKFRQIDRVFLDVGGNPDSVPAAADEVFTGLSTNTIFGRITYRIEMGGQQKIVEYLTGALPNLFTEADAEALGPKLEPAAVRKFLIEKRRQLAGPEGMVLKDIVAADPVGMTGLVMAKVVPLQTGFGDAQVVEGRITSRDGRHVLMMAEPKIPSSNSRAGAALVSDLLALAGQVEKKFPGIHVAITGGHRMSVDNATMIKADAARCISIGTTGMLVLYLTAYRRRWLSFVTFLPSLFSTLIAGAVLALSGCHLSAIAMGFASIALGITVDYAIYIIYHLDEVAGADRTEIGRHLGRLVFPISIGAVTTIAAFVVMLGSPMRGYQQLGIFGAIGVLFSVVFALVILPLLVPVSKKTGQPPLWLTRWLGNYLQWQTRWRLWLVGFVVVVSVATGWGVRRLRFEGDISKLNGITESTRRDDAWINETWGSALGMTLVVARGETPEDALAANDRATEILARDPNVSAIYSLSAICPSPATQERNLQRWRAFWTVSRRETLRQTLQQVGGELGFRADAFDLFWQRVEGERGLLTLQMFQGTPLENVLSERVALAPGDNAISTLVKLKDRGNADRLQAALPGTIVLDHKAFADHIARLVKHGLGKFAMGTGLAVAVLLYLTLASIEMVAATLLPMSEPPMTTEPMTPRCVMAVVLTASTAWM